MWRLSLSAMPHGYSRPSGSPAAGCAASEADTEHAQLAALRRFLLIDGLLALKQASQAHYEAFRRATLRRRRRRRALVAVIAAATARLARLGREEWRGLLLLLTPKLAPPPPPPPKSRARRATQWWRE